MAMGMVVSAFILAQKHWTKSQDIPFDEWPEQLNILIDVKLSERRQSGIYVKGSKEAFSWLTQKRVAGSSFSDKKSEQLKKAREAKKIKKEAESVERSLNGDRTEQNGSEALTLSLPHSPSLSQSTNSLNSLPAVKEKPDKDLNIKIWEAYKAAYIFRYKVEPVRNGSVNGKISQIGKRLGQEAVEVVKFFVNHPEGFYLKNLHAIGLCLRDCESLRTQMLRKQTVTSLDVRNFENSKSTSQTYADKIQDNNRRVLEQIEAQERDVNEHK